MQPGTAEASYHTGKPRRMAKLHQQGLTLIELIVAIAVVILMATWGIPSFQQFAARNEVAAEVMRIKTALALARNTAITRRTTVSVCSSPSPSHETCTFSDWSNDWVIVAGEVTGDSLSGDTILRVMDGPDGVSTSFNRNDRPVSFSPLGWSQGYNGTFTVCGQQDVSQTLIINNTGRVRKPTSQPDC